MGSQAIGRHIHIDVSVAAPNPMELPFTHRPGRRERHLRRRHENPLFGLPPPEVSPEELLAAQQADHEEMEGFASSLRELVQRAAELPAETGSEAVLALKADLERHYEQACGLPGEHEREKAAIARLIDVIVRVIRRHAGGDPLAREELDQAETARAIHFRLLGLPLIADLLHPDSSIAPADLAPSVLVAEDPELAALPEVFSHEQLAEIVAQAEARLDGLADQRGLDLERARTRLNVLRGLLVQTGSQQ